MMIVPGMHRPWLAAVSVLGLVGSLLAVGAGPAGGTAGVSDNEAIYSACVGPALESVGLVDVEGSFAEDAVNCLAHFGVTVGRTATTYDPGSPVLRWQMALFLSRAAGPAGIALPANPADGFTDIGGLFESARTAINQMAALDIMLGLRGTEFGPNTLVSRAQMALMLDSFLVAAEKGAGLGLGALGPDADELADVDPDDDMFGDIDSVTRSEYSAIRRMFELGVTRGTSDGQFSPRRLVTRAQMAVFITRMLAHTVARPAGLTVQASKSSVVEDEPVMLAVSVRDSGLMAVPGSLVDVFSSSAPDDAFGSDGRCSGNGVSAVGGSRVCEIALGDKTTDASGDLELTADGLASTTIWAWTGEVGDQYDADDTVGSSLRITAAKPGVRLRVTDDMPEGANSVEFGERVVFTLQVVDEDGNSVAKKDESVIVAAAVTITTGGDNDSSSSTLAHKTDASGKIELAFRQTDPRSGNPGDSARLDLDVSLASGSSLVLEDQSTLGKAGSDGSAEGDAAVLWREAASAAPATTTTTTVATPAAALPPDPDGIYTGDPLQLIPHAEFTRAYTLPGSAGDRFDVWLCNTPSVRYYSENPDIRHNPSNYADKFHSQVSPWFRWLSGGLYTPMFRPGGVVTVGLSFDYYQSCYREVLNRYPDGGPDTDGVVIVVGSRARYDGPLGQGSCGLFSQRTFPGNHRAVLVNGSAFTDPTVLAHEMGHALCWPHSFSGETEYRGEVWEYDNPMDIMGWSSSVQSAPVPGLGTHAVNRYAAGWIPPSQVAVHTPGTTARYTLEPIGGDGLQMLIVPYEADDRLSYRALGVRVRGEGDLWWADEDIVEEGVEIYHIDQTVYGCDLPDRGYCYGLDRRTRPLFDRDDGYEARDAAHVMQPDDAWYWRDGDAIEVISRDGDSFVVEVRPYTE